MLKIKTKCGKILEITNLTKTDEALVVSVFKSISEEERNLMENPLLPDNRVKIKDIDSIEMIEEETIGVYDTLRHCSKEYIRDLYDRGILK